MKALRIVGGALVAIVLLGGAAFLWLTARESVPLESSYRIDLDNLRLLASRVPGPLPLRLNHQKVATASMPRAALFAGESFEPHSMVHGAYQIVYPGGGFVVVDAAFGPAMAGSQQGVDFDPAAWESLVDALARADRVVITHEHFDHIAGLAEHPEPAALSSRVVLTAAQLSDPEGLDGLGIDEALRQAPLDYEGAHALAPGVVLVEAAGHSPGSQLVYVRLDDQSEWLLLGDVAWHMDMIRNLHYRPRLVTDFILNEDRAAVLAQLRTLHDLMNSEPVQLVVSHDAEQREQLVRSGRMGGAFE